MTTALYEWANAGVHHIGMNRVSGYAIQIKMLHSLQYLYSGNKGRPEIFWPDGPYYFSTVEKMNFSRLASLKGTSKYNLKIREFSEIVKYLLSFFCRLPLIFSIRSLDSYMVVKTGSLNLFHAKGGIEYIDGSALWWGKNKRLSVLIKTYARWMSIFKPVTKPENCVVNQPSGNSKWY